MEERETSNCFDEFNDISPKRKEPTIQILYDYEKHYLDLLKKYKPEIEFIEDRLKSLRDERKDFYREVLPEIIETMKKEREIDESVRKDWEKRLKENMEKSFKQSELLLNEFATKRLEEFKQEVKEKLEFL